MLSWAAGDTLGNCPPQVVQITPPGDVDLYGYEVVVIREVPEPAGEIEARLDPDDEVEKGNQTITEGLFCTTGVDPCELPE